MTREQAMATEPVKTLSLKLGVPIMLSMALQAFYNIVDSAFVTNIEGIGEQAATALTLAYPIQMLMSACIVGTGIGASVLLARCLGEGDQERANRTAGNTIFFGILFCILFFLFGTTCTQVYINSQTDTALVQVMGAEYLSICCVFSFGYVTFGIYEKLLQATGRSLYSTIGQVVGALTNILLDPILIYGWFGFSAHGVKGAAYATVIGQLASGVICFYFYYKHCPEVNKNIHYLRPSKPIVKGIFAVGLPAIFAQGLTSLTIYGLNLVLGTISESMVTAYGLYYKVQYFVLMATYGLKDGTTPIISYALGAGNTKRVREGVFCCVLYSSILLLLGFIALQILAVPLANLFGLAGDTRTHYIAVSRIATISFFFTGANIALQSGFQALGRGLYSVIVSIGRQFLFIVPVAYGFSLIALSMPEKSWLIWLTFSIGELMTLAITITLMKRTFRELDAHPSQVIS